MQTMMRSPSSMRPKSATAAPILPTMRRSSLDPYLKAPSSVARNGVAGSGGIAADWPNTGNRMRAVNYTATFQDCGFFAPRRFASERFGCALEEPLVVIATLVEQLDQVLDVVGAAGLERDVDRGLAQVDPREGAIVHHLLDVGAHPGDLAGELVERAGVVGDAHPHPHQAAVLDQAALDDARQDVDVDVAAADQDGDLLADEAGLALHQRRQRHRAGALGDRLFALEQQEDGVGD